jgi:hypothetical protein
MLLSLIIKEDGPVFLPKRVYTAHTRKLAVQSGWRLGWALRYYFLQPQSCDSAPRVH